ncbi:hypothetical protein HMPREF0658_1243 [Hoylesella marshii DSM 16973 = JCM 13450]|uniref:Uncharacterized protein n=1 Tax=Hoylesella marshii DSM 16973 = JCM 13450 TaxID=862515 RepID=E0NT16_9BACT|nr:hypothetical protein HMPREF0658_1243 [Hoylesella marshii DSM 16973 = JCM 13450]
MPFNYQGVRFAVEKVADLSMYRWRLSYVQVAFVLCTDAVCTRSYISNSHNDCNFTKRQIAQLFMVNYT